MSELQIYYGEGKPEPQQQNVISFWIGLVALAIVFCLGLAIGKFL